MELKNVHFNGKNADTSNLHSVGFVYYQKYDNWVYNDTFVYYQNYDNWVYNDTFIDCFCLVVYNIILMDLLLKQVFLEHL